MAVFIILLNAACGVTLWLWYQLYKPSQSVGDGITAEGGEDLLLSRIRDHLVT
ncbi:hypothetical protein [Nostoc sp. NIES-3756]|uniref:hypothetical protein n=1 Tax=Nostoc sp. NIES-3756 TaxID=1751286 RepID=UPI0014951299|nr:hypothetical protein [Nostoc sp. NIES-3756]